MEILHPRQRRHRARPLRHDPRLCRGRAGDRRRLAVDGVDRTERPRRVIRAGASQRRIRIPAVGLWHQGGIGAASRMAARRPCRGPDADLGGAVGTPPQCRALCGAALQNSSGGQRRRLRAGAAHGDDGPVVCRLRGLHALPKARHKTHVRLLLDRAHGHHRLRLRHGRTACEFRGAPAHDDALARQIGDLFRRRPHRAGQGYAAYRRDRRSHREPSLARLEPRRRRRLRSPACRPSASSPASSWW